jgi:tetratricopeptide (TPR) repeat protein
MRRLRQVRAGLAKSFIAGIAGFGAFTANPLTAAQPAQAAAAHSRPASSGTFTAIAAKATGARDAERLDEAVPLFRKALALNPKWAEGWWSLGTIYYDSDRYAEGAIAFEHLTALQPEDGTTHLMLGLCLYELDQNEDASKHLALARKFGIQDAQHMEPILMYHEAMLALRLGRFETANQTLHQLTRKGGRSEEINLAYGMSVLQMRPQLLGAAGSPERAIVEQIGHAEASDSTDTHAQARDLYERAVAAAPDFPDIHFAYGRFLLGIQEPDAAMGEFQQELKRNPANIRAKLEIAAIDYRTDSAAGIPYAEDAVKSAPRYPFAHYLLGLLCLDAGELPRSIEELETARKMVPDEPQFSFALANAYAKAHRKEDAAAARAEFVRLQAKTKDNDATTYYDSGIHTALRIGDSAAAPDAVH